MTAMLVRALRFLPLSVLVVFTVLFSASFERAPSKSTADLPNEVEVGPRPFDEPIEAQEFYNLKRAPVGQKAIPVERYLTANDGIKLMTQYSSATNSFENLGTWTQLGPGNVGGRTRALVIDPASPSTMYSAGVAGGIWKTSNGGGSWAPIGDLLPNLAVTCLALDTTSPVSARILYAGTGEIFSPDGVRGAGIFKSTDSGGTWVPLNTSDMATFPSFYFVSDIAISPNNSQTIFAATAGSSDAGVWRSVNGGAKWKNMLAATGGCQDLAIRTDRNPDYVLAACGSAIYRSTTGGGQDTWTVVYTESGMARTSLAIAPSNQNFVYALASSASVSDLLAVLKSTDGGGSWVSTVRGPFSPSNLNTTLLSNPIFPLCFPSVAASHQGFYDNVIAVDPSPVDPANPNRVWAGGIDLFRSDDGGVNWGIASYWWAPNSNAHYAHADQHVIVFHPQYNGGTNKTMFVGNDGGVFRTDNALAGTGTGNGVQCDFNNPGVSWASLNNNYGVTQFYHGLPYPNGATYIGGTQDNGTVRGSDSFGINGWSTSLGGDGGYVAIDASNPSIVYAEQIKGSLKKSFDGGASFTVSATTGITDLTTDFPFIAPFVMDPSSPQRLWIGGRSMWRTTDGANNWVQASAPIEKPCPSERPCPPNVPVPRGISAIAGAPTNPNRVLAGTFDGFIYRTDAALASNSATAWNNVQIRTGVVSWISFDPADINNNIVYAAFSSFNSPSSDRHIYKSTDGGVSWVGVNGWTLDIPVHCIVVDPNNSSKLYIGTDLGVFVSLDGGATWNRENTGFANAVTESLAFNTVGGATTLFAFTHGRGVWRVPVTTAPPPPPPGSAQATFIQTDVTTQGAWHGAYGSDGYNVINDSANYPGYAQIIPSGQFSYTWASSTTDVRALQKATVNDRIAATWYADTSFTIDLNVTDGGTHQVALYFLDWDFNGRAEGIAIFDAVTNTVLDGRSVSGFSAGKYLVWNMKGHVRITITKTAGYNIVLSGLFFGGGGGVTAQATFIQTDMTTQGTWHGAYGSDGYNVIDDSTGYPSYALVSASGQSDFVWASATTDVRALQKALSTTDRIAACWHAINNFTIDLNLTDGQTHRIALYCLDWDLNGRSETVDIIDASNATVLNSQSVAAFSNGKYLVWNIRGHVQIRLTKTAGYNIVLSGIFFN